MSASSVRELFGKETLYAILGVESTATTEQIKRAYFKKALQWVRFLVKHFLQLTSEKTQRVQHSYKGNGPTHPDKAGDDPIATKRFQALSYIHSILSDPGKRKTYDRYGSVEDVEAEGDTETAEMWYNYWRTFFPPVTEEAVLTFEKEYRESKEEKEDILRIYEEMEGDMDSILDNVMCSRVDDTDRFVVIIHEGIQTGKVTAFDAFTELYGDGSVDYTDDDKEEEDKEGEMNKSSSSRRNPRTTVVTSTTTKLSSSSSSFSSSKPSSKNTSTASTKGGKQPTRRGLLAAKRAQTARESRAADEAAEAEEMLTEMRAEYRKQNKSSSSSTSHNSEPSLTELIIARQANRNRSFASMITALESKYGGNNTLDDDEDVPRTKGSKKLAIKDHHHPSSSSSAEPSLSTPVRVSGNKRNNYNEKKTVEMDITSPPKGRRKQNN